MDVAVANWLDAQPTESIWINSITVFEARFGIALLPKGRKRDALERVLDTFLDADLEGRVQDFDRTAAMRAASLAAKRRSAGRPVDMRDTQIAGIALARHASLATRNLRHFQDLDVPVVDPWSERHAG